MSIGEKASQGFFSFLTRNIISRFMGLISLFILARKLSPYDFGLVSFTDILLMFIAVFGSTGLNQFLIAYKKDDINEILKASFWFNIILSLGIIILFFALTPFWAASKHDDRIINLAFISGLTFFIGQMQVVPQSILSRNLDFKTTVKIQNPFIIIIPIAKIIAALMGLGVYSLTIPTLMFIPIQTYLYYRAVGWKFDWNLYTHRWKEIYHYTKHLIGNSLLTRIMEDGDKFILTSFLGIKYLGIYNMAYQLSSFVGLNFVYISQTVLASVLPKYTEDLPKMKEHFLSFTKVLSFFTFPVIILMAIFAKPIILATNGEKWLEVVIPFQILSIYALVRSITSSRGSVLNALHLNKISFKLNLIYTPLHVLFSVFFSYYTGIIGLSISVVFLRIVFGFIGMKETMNALGGNLKEFLLTLVLPLKIISLTCIPSILLMYILPFEIFDDFINQLIGLHFEKGNAIIYATLLFMCSFVFYIFIVRILFKKDINEIYLFLERSNKKISVIFKKIFKN